MHGWECVGSTQARDVDTRTRQATTTTTTTRQRGSVNSHPKLSPNGKFAANKSVGVWGTG